MSAGLVHYHFDSRDALLEEALEAGALIAYAYDVAERTVAARKECCRKVETRRAYRAARASEYGA